MIFILSIISFFLLFFLSRKLTSSLFSLFSLLTKSKKVSMHLLSLLLLPGTAIHEFSHLVIATILQVPTGKLSLTPEFDEAGGIRAGSLKLAKSDPFRGTLIGLAPVIVGLTILGIGGHLFLTRVGPYLGSDPLQLASYFLLLFEIGNTMFTSKSDLRDATIVGFFLLGLFFFLHGLGVEVSVGLPQTVTDQFQTIAESLSIGLVAAAGIDIVMLLVIRIFIGVLRALFS